jgi:hypothetical protein
MLRKVVSLFVLRSKAALLFVVSAVRRQKVAKQTIFSHWSLLLRAGENGLFPARNEGFEVLLFRDDQPKPSGIV